MNGKLSRSGSFGLFVLCGAGAAVAQSVGAVDGVTVPNGLANSAVETPRSLLELQAGTQNSKATVRAGVDSTPDYRGPPEVRHLLSRGWSITGSGPLGTGTDPTQLATLDGLADAVQIALKSQWVYGSYREAAKADRAPFEADIRKKVEETNELLGKLSKADRATRLDNLKKAGCKVESDKVVFKPGTGSADCLLSAAEADQYRNLFFVKNGILLFPGVGGTVGNKSYKFLDQQSDKTEKTTRTPWSVQAYLGLHMDDMLVTVGYRYERSYKDAETGTLCPAPTNPLTKCKTGALGEPSVTSQSVPFIEYRQRLPGLPALGPLFRNVAVAPLLSYDTRKSVVGVSVPLYFVPDSSGKLTGGISLGWRSDQGGLQASVIVSTAFSAFPAR